MKIVITLISLFFVSVTFGQKFNLSGTVYDYFNRQPVESVDVFCNSGSHTLSDSVGHYSLQVSEKDSIWFSFLGKDTRHYSVDTITNPQNFEIALYIDAKWLPNVTVQNKSYKQDSAENRQEYAKVFNFKKPGIRINSLSNSPGSYVPGSVVGLDLDELINMFRFRRNRQILTFQERLIREERDKYIDHRFSKPFIKKLTGITSEDELDIFMKTYRPEYEILLLMNDLELGYYIQQAYKSFKGEPTQLNQLNDTLYQERQFQLPADKN